MSPSQEWKPCTKKPVKVHYREVAGPSEEIKTREGTVTGYAGRDFIIKGVEGELYPISKEIFAKTYTNGGEVPGKPVGLSDLEAERISRGRADEVAHHMIPCAQMGDDNHPFPVFSKDDLLHVVREAVKYGIRIAQRKEVDAE